MVARFILPLLLLLSSAAYAADNAVIVTPGSGVTLRSKDIGGGVQSGIVIPGDTAGTPLATVPGTPNASFALPVQGVTGGTPLPVTQSPQTPTTATMQSAATGNANGTVLTTTGLGAAMLTVNCAACAGGTQINFEGTQDGSAYVAISSQQLGTNTVATTVTTAGVTVWQLSVAGFTNIRARISAYSAGTVTVTGTATVSVLSNPVSNVNQGTSPWLTRQTNQYPSGATVLTSSNTGTTGTTTATLTGASSVTTYICGFSIRANASSVVTGNAVVSGTISGSLNFTQWTAPNTAGLGVAEEIFVPCLPASGTNTSVVVTSAAPGIGGVVSVTAWGYRL